MMTQAVLLDLTLYSGKDEGVSNKKRSTFPYIFSRVSINQYSENAHLLLHVTLYHNVYSAGLLASTMANIIVSSQ